MADGSSYNFVTTPIGVQDIARRAAELLEQRGWCQGTLTNRSGQMCLVGALDEAVDDLNAWPLRLDASETVRLTLGVMSIPFWNDQIIRTKEEVVAVLRKVADG